MDRNGGLSRISVRMFCLTVPKKSVGGTFSVHYFREPKKSGKERGDYQDFPSKIFVSQRPNSLGEPFTVALVSGIEKIWIKGGGEEYHHFPS